MSRKNNKNKITGKYSVITSILMIILLSGCTSLGTPNVYHVGILSGAEQFAVSIDSFKTEMTKIGYIEGQNIVYDTQRLNDDPEGEKRVSEKFVQDNVDLILYDLKLLDEEEHVKYTGVSLELILDNLRYLCKKNKEIIIRIPIIPSITDTLENINQIGDYVSNLKCISRVDILPFNKMGEAKYRRLEKPYMLNNITPPSEERMNEIKKLLEAFDLNVKIGG